MTQKDKFFFFFLFALFLFCGCRMSTLEKAIKEIYLSEIVIPKDNLVEILANADSCPHQPFCLLVYICKDECSGCTLDHMPEWGYILKELNQKETEVQMSLIWEQPIMDEYTRERLSSYDFPMTVYWDSTGVFIHRNPQIGQFAAFHTLLLNHDNKVLIVGNPVRNKEVLDLMCKTVSQKSTSAPMP